MLRRPAALLPLEMMNTRCSVAAVRPATASDASPPSVSALVMAWRRLPCPVVLVLTTVSKLKPKSRALMLLLPSVTGATFCAVPLRPAL